MANRKEEALPILGKLPEQWQVKEFGDVLEGSTRNGVYKPKEYHGRGSKIVNMGELFSNPRLWSIPMKRIELTNSELEKSQLKRGDLLFARRSLVAEGAGKCSIVCEITEPTTFESSIIRARPKNEIVDSFYLYYLFNSPYGRYILSSIRRQVAVAGITGTDLCTLNIPYPPLSEQKAIAHILGTLDDKIELNRQMNETLEAMARAIFKGWFVDFDPVRAKAEGRDPGLPPEIANLFPSGFEDSELGPIPKGWETISIYDVAEYINGIAYRNVDFSQERKGLPVVKITELKNGITNQTNFTEKEIDFKYRIDNGEILFSWSGNPDTSIDTFIWTLGPAWLNQHIFRILPYKETNRYFVFFLLKYLKPVFVEIARDKQTIGLGHVTISDLKLLKTSLPSQKTIEAFNSLVGPICEQIYLSTTESYSLATIRDTLLPKLLSGEIRVPEVEKMVEDIL